MSDPSDNRQDVGGMPPSTRALHHTLAKDSLRPRPTIQGLRHIPSSPCRRRALSSSIRPRSCRPRQRHEPGSSALKWRGEGSREAHVDDSAHEDVDLRCRGLLGRQMWSGEGRESSARSDPQSAATNPRLLHSQVTRSRSAENDFGRLSDRGTHLLFLGDIRAETLPATYARPVVGLV